MPITDRNLIYDGFTTLAGGQDSGRNPSQLDPNQGARLNNAICRGGVGVETRPPFKAHALNWTNRDTSYLGNGMFDTVNIKPPEPIPNGALIVGNRYQITLYMAGDDFTDVGADSNAVDVVFEATGTDPIWANGSELSLLHGEPEQSVNNFHDGVFQDVSYFSPRGADPCFMAMVAGRQYKITPRFATGIDIQEIPLPYRNRKTFDQAYSIQADRFHVTQDGESKPIIYDGATSRRATDKEVPVGTFMAYGMGRLCVAVASNRQIEFGDLYGSSDSTDPGDAVIMFTETTFLNEGFNASIAFDLGAITGLRFAPQQDSAVGDGELLAFSENGASSFFLSQPRENWKDSAFQRVTLINIGGRGHGMIVSFNGDLWFRSDDGWRSYRQARAEIQGWAHLPMSTEVRPYLDADTPSLLRLGSAVNFNNRLISTCTPRTNQGRPYHNGLLSLDFDVLSTFGQATKPAWDGHWDKLKFLKLVTGKFNGVNRCFAFAIDADGKNQIYELMPEAGGDDFDGPISATLEMRSMTCNSPFNEKECVGGDIWIDNVTSEVVVTAQFKSDQQPDWQDWVTLNVIEAQGECGAITCGGVPTIRRGYYPRRTLPTPYPNCSDQTKRKSTRFFEFQPKLTWTGHCVIRRFRLTARELPEDGRAICP